MFLKVISDIHIHEDKIVPSNLYDSSKTKDTILLVAGDICSPYSHLYATIIRKFSNDFKKVFIVAGNREYYNEPISVNKIDYVDSKVKNDTTEYSISNIDDKIDSICKSMENCVYLNNNSYEYDDVIFYGGTLWYSIERSRVPLMKDQTNKLDLIRVNGATATFDDIQKINTDFINNLSKLVENNNKNKPIIIISHFPPDSDSLADREFLDNKKYYYKDFFQNNLTRLCYPSVNYWFYGHTHTSQSKIINSTILVSNPYKNLTGCYSPSLKFFFNKKK